MGFKDRAIALGELVERKQTAYGNSAGKSADILRILYPNGIQPHQYEDVLLMVRMFDKLSRISQRGEDGADKDGESPYEDIAGYSLLGLAKDEGALALNVATNSPPTLPPVSLTREDLERRAATWVPHDSATADGPHGTTVKDRVMGVLGSARSAMTSAQIADAIGARPDNVSKLLSMMASSGLVIRLERGLYAPAGSRP